MIKKKKADTALLDALAELVQQYSDIPPEKKIEKLMDEILRIRNTAREQKNWGIADTIREKLESLHLEIQDTETGTHWRLK